MRSYKLHFIRHGQTLGNLQGRYVGQTDLPVCEEGIRELQTLSEEHDYPTVHGVYSSPLSRCRQTADILYPDSPLTVVEDLREINFGAFEGKGVEELSGGEVFRQWLRDSYNVAPPGGESGQEFAARITGALEQIFADMMESRITSAAVITHGGVIMTLLSLFGLPQEGMGRWVTENGRGYTVIMNPQLWMRDHKFEIFDLVPPLPPAQAEDSWDYEED